HAERACTRQRQWRPDMHSVEKSVGKSLEQEAPSITENDCLAKRVRSERSGLSEGLGLTGTAVTATGHLSGPCPRGMTCFHGPLVGFASAGAGHIGPLCLAEGESASPLGKLQRVSHHNVGCRECITRKIGRARE